MEEQFQVNLDLLLGSADRLNEVIRSLDAIHGAFGRIQERTGPVWEGRARDRFAANCRQLQQNIVRYRENLVESRDVLREAVERYALQEEKRKADVDKLSTTGIF